MFLRILLTSFLAFSAISAQAQTVESQATEIAVLQKQVQELLQKNEQMLSAMRVLEKDIAATKDKQNGAEERYDELMDMILQIQNVDVTNLRTGQKALYERIPEFTWGQGTADCADIASKHQQIEIVKNKESTNYLRFLCFDGKAIHLGTELTRAPQ